LLYLAIWLLFSPLVALVLMVFTALMIAQGFIDWDTMEIPDIFSIGGFALGLLLSLAVPALHGHVTGWWTLDALRAGMDALVGGFIGSALLLWIALFAEVLLRKEAMGFGDVKLMGAIGAFCGWQGAIFAIFGGAVLGTLLVAFLMVTGLFRRHPADQGEEDASEGGVRMPFGPALGAGALLYLLVAQTAFDRYLAEIAEVLGGRF
jgi:leader peptidase (prepilin peptidase)/N-methyltransferase